MRKLTREKAPVNEFTEVERQLQPLIDETRAAIGGVARALRRELKPLISGRKKPVIEGHLAFRGPYEANVPISQYDFSIPGFQTMTVKGVDVTTWRLGRLRKYPGVVQLSFNDSLQTEVNNTIGLKGRVYDRAAIAESGVALFNHNTEYTKTTPGSPSNDKFKSPEQLKANYAKKNRNALGLAKLVATGVSAATDIDSYRVPISVLNGMYYEWAARTDPAGGSCSADNPAVKNLVNARFEPIYTLTTIPHLEQLRVFEAQTLHAS